LEGDAVKLAIVGGFGGTHIGGSLAKAAVRLGHSINMFDIGQAVAGNRILRMLKWRFAGHRPLHLGRFSAEVVAGCAKNPPDCLISTGAAALTRRSLSALHEMRTICVNYSTDDPWNPNQRARWYLRALPHYSVIFTARLANISDFQALGCHDVHYLPFGYDDELFAPPSGAVAGPSHDVLFVGWADGDRVAFAKTFMRTGPKLTLVGGYWDQVWDMRQYSLGLQPPETLRLLTAAAKVNLCLVRRANRDDNVMRSFEIGAVGGCMIAEDTPGHRAIFGPDGEAVLYFRNAEEAAACARRLLANPTERMRLAASTLKRVTLGEHTYRDRLTTMIGIASSKLAGPK
jgi:spore maturation protein CgeB